MTVGSRRRLLGVSSAALILVSVLASACTDERSAVESLDVLGGFVRVPTAAGVLTTVTGSELTLDDGTTYPLSPDGVTTFSTYNLAPLDLVDRIGLYVHVGLDEDGRVNWVAVVGHISAEEPPSVLFTSNLLLVENGYAYFDDGTALATSAAGPDVPLPTYVHARIDVATDTVTQIVVP